MKTKATQKVMHRHIGKITFTLIAAALTLTLLVSTAFATGSFSSAYGYLFSGECEGEFYKGGDSAFTCDDPDINFEILGVTGGSKYDAIAAYRITKADGTPFIEVKDSQKTYCAVWEEGEATKSLLSGGVFGSGNSGGSAAYLSEDGTEIYYYVFMDRFGASLLGNTYKNKFDGAKVGVCVEELKGNFNDLSRKEQAALYDKYEKQGLVFFPILETGEMYVYKMENYDFVVKSSVDLNYKYTNIDLTPDKEVEFAKLSNGAAMGIDLDEFELSGYSLKVSGNHTNASEDNANAGNTYESYEEGILPEKIVVTMKDGSKVNMSLGSRFDNEDEFTVNYETYDENASKMVFMDLDKVQSVSFGSLTLAP